MKKNHKNLEFVKEARVDGELVYPLGHIEEIDNSKGSADRWIRRSIARDIGYGQTEDADLAADLENVVAGKEVSDSKLLHDLDAAVNRDPNLDITPEDSSEDSGEESSEGLEDLEDQNEDHVVETKGKKTPKAPRGSRQNSRGNGL